MKKLFIIPFILLSLSCKQDPKFDVSKTGMSFVKIYSIENSSQDVLVVHDDEKKATCWIVYRGISCLPDQFLNIKEDKK